MVVPSPSPIQTKKTRAVGIPTIDLSSQTPNLPELTVKACEEYGFFKVVSHGVPKETISRLEDECIGFFSKPLAEKQRAGPASPFGYGCKNIGPNGDMGELEYLLLHSGPFDIDRISKTISGDPRKFSDAVDEYVGLVRELACKILDLVCKGLWLHDGRAFSKLIMDVQSDSLLRINHYPPTLKVPKAGWDHRGHDRVGFGEHSDPQILTILRSNDVEGLQICLSDGLWVPVPADPNAFYVMVGDALQVLTNGRFTSVRHRAILTNLMKPRMSMVYFGAPPLQTWIVPRPEMVALHRPNLYKEFTWGEYKKAMYSQRLGDCRLDLFKVQK